MVRFALFALGLTVLGAATSAIAVETHPKSKDQCYSRCLSRIHVNGCPSGSKNTTCICTSDELPLFVDKMSKCAKQGCRGDHDHVVKTACGACANPIKSAVCHSKNGLHHAQPHDKSVKIDPELAAMAKPQPKVHVKEVPSKLDGNANPQPDSKTGKTGKTHAVHPKSTTGHKSAPIAKKEPTTKTPAHKTSTHHIKGKPEQRKPAVAGDKGKSKGSKSVKASAQSAKTPEAPENGMRKMTRQRS